VESHGREVGALAVCERPLQTVIKAGNLIKGGNADKGFFNESNFYFLFHASNIQQNLKYHQQIYHHIIILHSV
jgi:hypothetical protein